MATSKLLARDGTLLQFADTGPDTEAFALVWIHGIAQSLEYWGGSLRYFPGYRHISVDVRGHGGSGGASAGASTTLPDLSQDVLEILSHLGVQEAVLIGHSMGGVICQRVALDAPQKVRAMVLAATSSRVNSAARAGYLEAAKAADSQGQYGIAAAQRAMSQIKFESELKTCSVPALIVQGGRDRHTPVRAGEILRDALKDAKLVVFPELGHNVFHESDEVIKTIQGWLSERGAVKASGRSRL